jgi:hypothetical protein
MLSSPAKRLRKRRMRRRLLKRKLKPRKKPRRMIKSQPKPQRCRWTKTDHSQLRSEELF